MKQQTTKMPSKLLFALVVWALLSASCGGTSEDTTTTTATANVTTTTSVEETTTPPETDVAQGDLSIIMVTHAPRTDTFWEVVANGFDDAVADMGVDGEYRGTQTTGDDPNAQRQLIENAIAADPDAIVVTNPSPDVLNDTIAQIAAAGIPFIVVNAGDTDAEALGAMTYVGNDEYQSGATAAKLLAEAGAQHPLVITIPEGILPLADLRTNGFVDNFPGESAMAVVPLESINDPTTVRNIVLTELQQDEAIDAMFSLGDLFNPAMLATRDELGNRGETMLLSSIDLGDVVVDALCDGTMEFALTQQQYLQGYLPVVYLTLWLRERVTPATSLVPTGPGVISKDNVDIKLGCS